MKKALIAAFCLVASLVVAASYTDLTSQDGKGPQGQSMITKVNANFDSLEVLIQSTAASDTVTNGEQIAVSSTYLQVTPSAVATCTVANATAAGQWLIVENVGTNNLVFADNGQTLALGANVTLGTDDILVLISSDTNEWREVATADN